MGGKKVDDQFDFMVLGVILGVSLAFFIGLFGAAMHDLLLEEGRTNYEIAGFSFFVIYFTGLWLLFLLEKKKEIRAKKKNGWLLFGEYFVELHWTWFLFWNLIFMAIITWTYLLLLFVMIWDGLL